MAYLLRGGPRDRQLVDDLPRGYRPAPEMDLDDVRSRFDELLPVDAAEWAAGDADSTRARSSSEPRVRLQAL